MQCLHRSSPGIRGTGRASRAPGGPVGTIGPAILVALLVLPLLLAGAAPLTTAAASFGSAQSTVAVKATSPDPRPPGSSFVVPVRIEYSHGNGGSTDGRVTVHVSVASEDPVVGSVSPSTFQVRVNNGQGSRTVDLSLDIGEGAEAFRAHDVQVTARAEPDGSVAGSQGSTTLAVLPDFVPDLGLVGPTEPVGLSATIERVPILVRNLANGPVFVQLETIEIPVGLQVAVPSARHVGYTPDDPTEARLDIVLVRPDDQDVDGQVVVRADYWFPGKQDQTLTRTDDVAIAVRSVFGLSVVHVAAIAAVAVAAGFLYWFKIR